MPIRPYTPADLARLHQINQAGTPGVGSEDTPEGLARWLMLGTCLVLADEADAPLGFINLVPPGTAAYISANLRWFEAWQQETGRNIAYVDRIAIAPEAQGSGHGQRLYEAAFAHARGQDGIGAEVNTDPDNPGSHRFHQRLGFVEVGRKRYKPDYEVAYYVRDL